MTTAPSPRFIVVDDSDTTITYSGSNWTTDTSAGLDKLGDWGGPYKHTVHGISGNGSLSFQFNGSYIDAYASFDNPTNDSIPEWTCLVDGVPIANDNPPDRPNNNWKICHSLTDFNQTMHNFTIQVKAAERTNSTFWFDWAAYVPSFGFFPKRATILMLPDDFGIRYKGFWGRWNQYGMMGTGSEGSSAIVSFFGVSASWYGFVEGTSTPSTGKGSYTVDGGEPTTFTWSSPKDQTTYKYLFFTTPDVDPGSHELKVTFLGSSPKLSPLSLSQVYVKMRPPAMETATVPVIHPMRIQAIYGGVLGGLSALFLFGAIGGILFWKRREHLQRHKNKTGSPQPSISSPSPIEPAASVGSNKDGKRGSRRRSQDGAETIPLYNDGVRRHHNSGVLVPDVGEVIPIHIS